jgi:hypothetical protein
LCLSNGLKLLCQSSESLSEISRVRFSFWIFFRIMCGSGLLHRQRSSEDFQQLLAWYKIRDTLLGQNCVKENIKKVVELASVCEHPHAVRLTKLFGGLDVASREEARRVFFGCERDPRALGFAALLVNDFEEIRRAAQLGDAFAQVWMAEETDDGRKNLLLKENPMVSTSLDIVTEVE